MKQTTRQAIVQAARRVVQASNVAALTLDAVAREAGVSKGGLLYHFPSKDALLAGMIEQLVEDFDTDLQTAAAGEPDGQPGRWTRAYAKSTCAPDWEPIDMSTDLLAAAALNPALLDPLRARYAAWQQLLAADGLDPTLATLVRLAADGLWFAEMFNLAPPDPALREQIVARLIALVQEATP